MVDTPKSLVQNVEIFSSFAYKHDEIGLYRYVAYNYKCCTLDRTIIAEYGAYHLYLNVIYYRPGARAHTGLDAQANSTGLAQ